MKRILVTGGSGYIGSHMVYDLIMNGYEPVVVDNFTKSTDRNIRKIEELTGKFVQLIEADLRQPLSLDIPDVEAILHFAAYKVVGESIQQPLKYYENNLGGTLNLLNWANENNIKKFIFSSTTAVYGNVDAAKVSEDTPTNTESPYGQSKLMSEQVIRDSCKAYGMSAVALRYFNVAGNLDSGEIGDEDPKPTALIPAMMCSHLGINPTKLKVFGDDYPTRDGTTIRDFIHVLDLVAAHRQAMEYLNDHSGFSLFNLGTETGSTIMEVIKTFESVTGQKLDYEVAPRREGDVVVSVADSTAALRELHWKANRNLDDIIASAWKWYSHSFPNKDILK